MPLVDIRVPQLGEGLQEALVVSLLKPAGTPVEKDEPVFEMETDKARVAVEAACAGRLHEWLVREGDVVPIGSVIGRIDAKDPAASEAASRSLAATSPGASVASHAGATADLSSVPVRIPPRTRAHGRALGLSDEELRSIPAPSGKLLPEDVDRYLGERAGAGTRGEVAYGERRMSGRQRTLVFRFRRSAQLVIPATITGLLSDASLGRALQAVRAEHPDTPVGLLEIVAYAVARAARAHPNLRSVLVGDDAVREYPHLTLGIAVHRTGGDLVTAVVPDADTLALPDLARTAQANIALALEGQDQSSESTQVILTYLGEGSIVHAVPTLVWPAIATLFVGASLQAKTDGVDRAATLSLTFDHRLINGIEAARFLRGIAEEVERLEAVAAAPGAGPDGGSRRVSEAAAGDAALRTASRAERIARLDALLRERVARLLGVESGTPDFRKPLRSLGLTSVMAVSLCQGLERDLGISAPATLVWNHPTVAAIAGHLAETVEGPGRAAASEGGGGRGVGGEAELERLLAEVEDLSDAEARRLLTEDREEGKSR